MTKLTTERLDEIANIKITEFSDGTDTANGAYQSVGSSEIVLMARQLLAYEQAAKNEVALPEALKYAEIYGRAFICVDRSGSVHAVNPTQITLTILNETAPVLPKQPQLVDLTQQVEILNRILNWILKELPVPTQKASAMAIRLSSVIGIISDLEVSAPAQDSE